jgi:hypothetical protein
LKGATVDKQSVAQPPRTTTREDRARDLAERNFSEIAQKSTPCWDCGTRYRTRDLIEVVDEHLEFNPFTFFGGEMLCPRCARRHGLL